MKYRVCPIRISDTCNMMMLDSGRKITRLVGSAVIEMNGLNVVDAMPLPSGDGYHTVTRKWSNFPSGVDKDSVVVRLLLAVFTVMLPWVPSQEAAPSIPAAAKSKAASFILSPGEFGAVPALPCVDPDF